MSILNGHITSGLDSFAGVGYALIALKSDIEIVFDDELGTVTITLSGGTAITPINTPFKKYSFPNGTSNSGFSQAGNIGTGTNVFTHTVNMTFKKRNLFLRNEIQTLTESETIVVMLDCNGYAELLGGRCNKGLFTVTGTGDSGVAAADLNGYVINLSAEQSKSPMAVDEATLLTIDPDQAV